VVDGDSARGENHWALDGRSDLAGALLEAALDGIIVMDQAGAIRELNPAAERMFGYSRSEALGRPLSDLIVVPSDLGPHERGPGGLTASGRSRMLGRRVELEAMRRDGAVFPVELAVNELRRPSGHLVVAYMRDLTERRAAESARLDSEAKLRAFIENAPISVHIRDSDGRYVIANPQTARLFRRPLNEIIGRHPHEILPPDMVERAERGLAQAQRTGEVQIDDEREVQLDPCLWLRTIRVPLKDAAGEVVGLGTFDIDITERKRADAELQRQREILHQREKLAALGSLLAGVAHELNNPLSVVLGRSIMLEEEVTDPALHEQLAAIRTAAERCARIVRTFLAMARQRPAVRRAVALEPALESAIELLAYGLQTTGIEVIRDWSACAPNVIEADEDGLQQVFLNLLVNAQQALQDSPEPRCLWLSTEAGDGWLELTVADNGPGIPSPVRPRVFDPFFTTKPEGAGTGIGLAVCHGIITSHGGSIEVTERPGGGARFTVRLPMAPSEDPGLAAMPEGAAEPLSAHVLVVDDEPDIVSLLADVLGREGCTVSPVRSGEEGIRELDRRRFDLVITDLRMAGQDGRALLDRLPRSGVGPAVIVLTGDVLGAPRIGAGLDPPPLVIEKPVEPHVLRKAVRQLLGGRRQPATKT
jgi:two-component system NtrC family sensor kinase